MQYLLLPLDQQFDHGFGIIGIAFREAALSLGQHQHPGMVYARLPENYLLRHAIELFLKSGVVIVHRKLGLLFDSEPPDSEPQVKIDGRWRLVRQVHSVGDLYAYWKFLITTHADALRQLCQHNQRLDIDMAMDGWIKTIEQTDRKSTYYRYPSVKNVAEDKGKSPFKERAVADVLAEVHANKDKPQVLLGIENQDRELVRSYALDDDFDEELREALSHAANYLNNYHAMMRIELTGGW